MPSQEALLQTFEAFVKRAKPEDPSWLGSLRKEAFSQFIEHGFPTTKQEDWKYTSVEPIAKSDFEFTFEPASNGFAHQRLEPFLFKGMDAPRLVFVNGLYSEKLSSLPQGDVLAGSLKEAFASSPEKIERNLARYASLKENAFTALNTAFVRDGVFVFLPRGKVLETPIHFLFVTSREVISQPRNLIVAEEESSATVIESYVSLSEDAYFTNAVTEISLGPGARIDHFKIQRESERAFHVATTQASLHRDSTFSPFSLSLGARLSRSNLNVILKEEGASCILNGLYLTRDHQHTDHHTLIDHTKPHGQSRQLYKGVLRDASRAVFNGKIFIRQDAQKTDAHQVNKNLLLSPGAAVDTKPQLEIFADDVKATHGAAVGELEEEMIFYVKSRGIGEEAARRILTYGFANEVIQEIKPEPLRSSLDQLVWQRLEERKAEAASG